MRIVPISIADGSRIRRRGWVQSRAILRLWPLLLVALILLPGLASFPFPSANAAYSDLATSHYPNALFLRRALQEWHTIPLWSPAILSGYPLAADPLSGLWYPPGWLALLLPLPFGFNLLVALHLVLGGAGMYSLLRQQGLGHPAALLGGLAFEFMPKLFAHYGAGHLTLLYAVPWTPWLLSSSHVRVSSGGQASVDRRGPALIFAHPSSWH
jgi:hypothetical protein